MKRVTTRPSEGTRRRSSSTPRTTGPSIAYPDRILFPKSDYTKQDAADYYSAIAPSILPHLKKRPLTLKLYPQAIRGEAVYIKDATDSTPKWVKTVPIERKNKSHGGAMIDFVLVTTSSRYTGRSSSKLDVHTFLARAPEIQRPSSVVFDLDPGLPATIVGCSVVALRIRKLFDNLGLASFVKASGSKGLQVYVP